MNTDDDIQYCAPELLGSPAKPGPDHGTHLVAAMLTLCICVGLLGIFWEWFRGHGKGHRPPVNGQHVVAVQAG